MSPQTGFLDHDRLEERALDYRPKLLICGGSAYPREWDYKRLRAIAGAAAAGRAGGGLRERRQGRGDGGVQGRVRRAAAYCVLAASPLQRLPSK